MEIKLIKSLATLDSVVTGIPVDPNMPLPPRRAGPLPIPAQVRRALEKRKTMRHRPGE